MARTLPSFRKGVNLELPVAGFTTSMWPGRSCAWGTREHG